MLKTWMVPAAAALAALLLAGSVGTAQALRGGGGHWSGGGMQMHTPHMMPGGPRAFSSGPLVMRHHEHRFADRRFHHRRFFVGAPVGVYAYSYYDDGCYWLRRRALVTGNSYWWNRYYACIGYDYY